MTDRLLFKDEVLDVLSASANVAQFVSFGPDLRQRFSRVRNRPPNWSFATFQEAAGELLKAAPDGTINVRSFLPSRPEGSEFLYGLRNLDQIVAHVRRLSDCGLYTILNETIDVNDGGVSGVLAGSVLEFAPGETPRCVEGVAVASLPKSVGLRLLTLVYGFKPLLKYAPAKRVEFSIHPKRRGYKTEHTVVWQVEDIEFRPSRAKVNWPNSFSRFLGDKVYGLLVGRLLGLRVPKTLVICRALAPFSFGAEMNTDVKWIRTCPREPRPGLFSTVRGWTDPFALLAREDPEGQQIASILVQDEVPAVYSGAFLATRDGPAIVEGVRGRGDELMLGRAGPEDIPREVKALVEEELSKMSIQLGSIRAEWVFDGSQVWLVQLQQEAALSSGHTIVPGKPPRFIRFGVSEGIDRLREIVKSLDGKSDGVMLVGKIGMTSHLADILRRARIPSFITDESIQQIN